MNGEYGLSDMYFGAPTQLGRGGMVRIVEYALDDDEKQMLDKSAAAVRETHDALKKLVAL
jgi:malate dehydrogenase